MAKFTLIVLGLVLVICLFAGESARAQPAAKGESINLWQSRYLVISQDEAYKYSPAVAYNSKHDEYLVVWENIWPSTNLHDIYARRVTNSGQLMPAFIVSSGPVNRMRPAVSYDSTHDQYLVVWDVDYNGDNSDWDVDGRFIPWDGPSPLNQGFAIDASRANTTKPRVTYGAFEDKFLVVWLGQDIADTGPYTYIAGAFIYDSMGGTPVPISSGAGDYNFPDVTYNLHRDEYVVVWDVFKSATGLDVAGVRLKGNGDPLGGGEFVIENGPTNEQRPTVAACDKFDNYLIAWQHEVLQPPKPSDDNIYGRFMNGDGTLGQIYGLEGTSLPQQMPRLSCNAPGTEYLLTWQDQYADPYLKWGIWAAPFLPDLRYIPSFQVVAPNDFGDRVFPAGAFGKTTALVTWQHYRDTSPYQDIWAQLVKVNVVFIPRINN